MCITDQGQGPGIPAGRGQQGFDGTERRKDQGSEGAEDPVGECRSSSRSYHPLNSLIDNPLIAG